MKKFLCTFFVFCIMISLLAGCGESDETLPPEMDYKLGETGVTVTLPTELGFEQMESEINEFFGVGASGDWSIIVNRDEKGDYPIKEYADLTAKANYAEQACQDSDGNYYFIYESDEYHYYTAVREGAECYYRVAFYCFNDVWQNYEDSFAQWAATIQVA